MYEAAPRSTHDRPLHSLTLVAPAEAEEERQTVAVKREQGKVAMRVQLSGVTAIVVAGSIDEIDGLCAIAPELNGWPHFVSEQGAHLFRIVLRIMNAHCFLSFPLKMQR